MRDCKWEDGQPKHPLRGTFTLRGISRPPDFQVLIAAADARRLTGQGHFELDRTECRSHYGSGKLFRFLGKHIVNDHIHLHVKIHAEREGRELDDEKPSSQTDLILNAS